MDKTFQEQQYAELERLTRNSELLWHYTDWGGLRGIIDSRNVWATHYTHLNDTEELVRSLKLGKEFLVENLAYLEPVMEDFANRQGNEVFQLFITSFSKAFDYLEQWRAYSGASIGFALGFDAKQLLQVAESYRWSLVECTYDDQKARDRAKRFNREWHQELEKVNQFRENLEYSQTERHLKYKSWNYEYRAVRGKFAEAMVPFKDECFINEQEVRLISQALVPGTDYRTMHPEIVKDFRLQGAGIVRFVKMPLRFASGHLEDAEPADPKLKTPLRAVMFGPTDRDIGEALDTLRLYASRAADFNIVVAASKRPIRSR